MSAVSSISIIIPSRTISSFSSIVFALMHFVELKYYEEEKESDLLVVRYLYRG